MTTLARESISIGIIEGDKVRFRDSEALAIKLIDYAYKHNVSVFKVKNGDEPHLVPIDSKQEKQSRGPLGVDPHDETSLLLLGPDENHQVYFGSTDRKTYNPGRYYQCKRNVVIARLPDGIRYPMKLEEITGETSHRLEIDLTWGEHYEDGQGGTGGERCFAKLYGVGQLIEDFLHQLL